MRLGVFPEERAHGQEVLISVRGEIKPSLELGYVDRLDATVDYSEVFLCIDRELQLKELNLIETAVNILGTKLLAQFPLLLSVQVEIVKPKLPHGVGRGAEVSIKGCFQRM